MRPFKASHQSTTTPCHHGRTTPPVISPPQPPLRCLLCPLRLQGDACALPGDLPAFDAVLAANLLCRLPDPSRFLARAPSLVKQGGVLVLVSPYSWLQAWTPQQSWLGGYYDKVGGYLMVPGGHPDKVLAYVERFGICGTICLFALSAELAGGALRQGEHVTPRFLVCSLCFFLLSAELARLVLLSLCSVHVQWNALYEPALRLALVHCRSSVG